MGIDHIPLSSHLQKHTYTLLEINVETKTQKPTTRAPDAKALYC